MPWTSISIPNVGTPVRRSIIKAIIENLGFLFSGMGSGGTAGTSPNASFELDSNTDNVPDEWTYTAGAGAGTGVLVTDDSIHGQKSFKFTRNAGGGNSGGTLEHADYFECSPFRQLLLQWSMKSSAAGVRVKVEVRFFTRTKVFVSTVTAYNSITNPTAWTPIAVAVDPPSNSYFAKVRITGGDTAPDVAANIWFDNFTVSPSVGQLAFFTGTGTWSCKVPRAKIRIWGGGGGGANGTNAGGGGAGAYAEAWVDTVPGTDYTVTVGTGGGAEANGTASSVGSLITAAGGGLANSASGGSGGASGSATVAIAGGNGENAYDLPSSADFIPGSGGHAPCGGGGGGRNGQNGRIPGGGGGGGGGSGANGRVIIEW